MLYPLSALAPVAAAITPSLSCSLDKPAMSTLLRLNGQLSRSQIEVRTAVHCSARVYATTSSSAWGRSGELNVLSVDDEAINTLNDPIRCLSAAAVGWTSISAPADDGMTEAAGEHRPLQPAYAHDHTHISCWAGGWVAG